MAIFYPGLNKLKLRQFFATAPAAFKNDAHYKSGQKWLESSHFVIQNLWHTL